MAGSGEWRSSPSAFCSHPALMPTPLSQLFQKNSEYFFSSSISNKKSSPIWRALSKSNIIDMARLKYLFFFLLWRKLWKSSLWSSIWQVVHRASPKFWSTEASNNSIEKQVKSNSGNHTQIACLQWHGKGCSLWSAQRFAVLPSLCCTNGRIPLQKTTHFVQDKPVSGTEAKQTTQVT